MIRNTVLATGLAATMAFSAAAEPVQIEWWHAMGGQLGDTVNEISKLFNESQSDYAINPVYKGTYEETLTATIAAFRAGEQPNIVQVFDAGAATIIGAPGAVIPAEDLIKQAGIEFDASEYISGVRNFYADPEGKMVGMPFNSSTPIMYYNEDALAKTGVTPPKTWEEFEEIAPKLLEAGYVPMAQSHLPWIFTENFFSRHNLPFATNDNGFDGIPGTEILINNAALKQHFTKVKEWLDAGLFGYYGTGWADNQSPFETGDVAIWLGSSGSFGGLLTSTEFPFSATYLPYWESVTEEPYATFIGGAALFAMSGLPEGENKASAEFFKFLSSADIQVLWHKETGYVPITNAAYDLAKAEGYYESTPQAEVGIQQLQLKPGENTKGYRMGFYVQIRDVMNREYGRLLSGDATVDEAFAIIEEEANKLLERFEKTSG